MIMRNWIELGLFVFLLTGGIISKLLLRKRLRDIDGLGPITKQKDGISADVVIEAEPVKTKEEGVRDGTQT